MARRRQSEKYEENPFLEDLKNQSKVTWHNKVVAQEGDAVLMDGVGEIIGTRSLITHEYVENNEFLKLYANGVGAILSLGNSGKKVFMLLCGMLMGKEGKNNDKVILNYDCLSETVKESIKRTTFYRGINECLEAKILAQSVMTSLFFVNPTYIFNGDRLQIIKTYERKR